MAFSLKGSVQNIPLIGGWLDKTISPTPLADAYDTHEAERKKYADLLRQNAGQSDPAEKARYQSEMQAPVDQAFQKASAGAAQSYAARGLSSSPVAGGAQAGAAGQYGNLSARIQTQAAESARKALRQRTLDPYGVATDSWRRRGDLEMQKAALAAQQDMANWDALNQLGSEAIRSEKALARERERERRRAALMPKNEDFGGVSDPAAFSPGGDYEGWT